MASRFAAAMAGLAALAAACSNTSALNPAEPEVTVAAGGPKTALPTGLQYSTLTHPAGSERFRLENHGGAIMAGTSAVYVTWYGNWTGNTATSILMDFLTNLGSSPYFGVVARFPDVTGAAPNSALIYAGAVQVGHPYGTHPSRTDIEAMLSSLVLSNTFLLDPNGIYVVLLSADVTMDGFATSWCGFHDRTVVSGTKVRYAVIVNPDRAPSVCAPPSDYGTPNGNRGADGMASHLAGLLASTVTDPDATAWYDRNGLELGQKCAWTWGTTYQTPNGARANVKLGQRDYLLPQLWWPTRKGGVCGLAEPT